MKGKIAIVPLNKKLFDEAVDLVLVTELDSREEIEHHLEHIDAHFVALDREKIVGVIGWYQDNVNYATKTMGDKFPGEDAYWVGFFAVDKNIRGLGVGFALFKRLEEEVRKMRSDKLYVSSVPETRKYYERQGFKLIMKGEINGNPKYFMVKKL